MESVLWSVLKSEALYFKPSLLVKHSYIRSILRTLNIVERLRAGFWETGEKCDKLKQLIGWKFCKDGGKSWWELYSYFQV